MSNPKDVLFNRQVEDVAGTAARKHLLHEQAVDPSASFSIATVSSPYEAIARIAAVHPARADRVSAAALGRGLFTMRRQDPSKNSETPEPRTKTPGKP
jgi:hypothetical protein